MPEEIRDRRLPSIQALRGIAASLVVFFHFAGLIKGGTRAWTFGSGLGNIGACGVDIFFVISGFIMVYTTRNKAHGSDALVFISRRAVRIYPLYWIWTSVMLVMRFAGIAQQVHRYTFSYILGCYLLIPSFNGVDYQFLVPQAWTLTFEMVFYLVFCASILFALRSGKLIFIAATFGILALLSGLFSPNSIPRLLFRDPIILEFLFGGLSAEVLFRLVTVTNNSSRRKIAIALLSAGTFLLLCTIALHDPVSIRAMVYGVPAFFLVLGAGVLGPTAAPRLLVYLGDCSYSIYLTHIFFALGYHTALKHFPVLVSLPAGCMIVLAATATIALSSLTYPLIEKPLTNALGLRRSTKGNNKRRPLAT
jgi:exopolysaccharide production protein ExoZ